MQGSIIQLTHMLNIELCRQILGKPAEALSDEHIREQRNILYALAGILADNYVHQATSRRAEGKDVENQKDLAMLKEQLF